MSAAEAPMHSGFAQGSPASPSPLCRCAASLPRPSPASIKLSSTATPNRTVLLTTEIGPCYGYQVHELKKKQKGHWRIAPTN